MRLVQVHTASIQLVNFRQHGDDDKGENGHNSYSYQIHLRQNRFFKVHTYS